MPMIPAWGISLMIAGGGMGLQYLFTPRVKQPPVDKGKMDDVRIQGSDYGAIIPWTSGVVRTAGNVIWSNGVQHYVIDTPSQGGKGGGGGPATRTHVYKTSLAVLVGRSEIETFLRIWADADLITDNSPGATGLFEAEDGTLTGGASSAVDVTAHGGEYVTGLGLGGKVVINTSTVPDPPRPREEDPDQIALQKTRLSFYYKCATAKTATIGTDVTSPQTLELPSTDGEWSVATLQILGFADSVSFEYAGAATADLDLLSIEKFWEFGPLERPNYRITGAVNEDIAYPTDLDDPSEYYNFPPMKDPGTGIYSITTPIPGEVVRFYTGTETQVADSAIKAWLDEHYGAGAGDLRASAMRGLSVVVFENFTLRQTRVPNFTFETDTGDDSTNAILEHLFSDVGLTEDDWDLTETEDLEQLGFLESTQASRRTFVEQLCRYHGFRLAEIDGKIKTVLDGSDSIASWDPELLRAHDDGEEMPDRDAEIVIKEEHLMPREVRYSAMNPDLEYHNDTGTAQLFVTAGTESVEYAFPVVDKLYTLRNKAEKNILKQYAADKGYEVFTMPELAKYSIGDVVTIPIKGVDHIIQIEKKQMGLPIGKVRVQGVRVFPAPEHTQDETTSLASKAASQYVVNTFPRNTVIFVIQSAPIVARDRGRLGVYLAISGRGRGDGENCALYREFAEDNYILHSVVDATSPLGLLYDAFSTGGGERIDAYFFDVVEFESVTPTDLTRNPTVNLARVGDEWIQFETATPMTLPDNSPYRSAWRFTDLTRGLFGTTDDSHSIDEYVCVVTPALRFYELDDSDIGETVNLKAVTSGQNIEVAPVSSFTFTPVSAYTVTNATEDRSFDANATTINELADVVATMKSDLNL